MKKILFCLPIGRNIPTGGVGVIYDYANSLVRDGYHVTIVYAAYLEVTDKKLMKRLKAILKLLYAILFLNKTGYTWHFKQDGLKELFVWKIKEKLLPNYDVCIATAVSTASYVSLFSERVRKCYFIQDYEFFVVPNDNYIRWTYRLPLDKIVISHWLEKLIVEEGQKCIVIPNGFHSTDYRVTIPIEKKDRYLISMLYHVNERKDFDMGLRAVKIAHDNIPQLRLVLFGAYPKPSGLPNWVSYYYKPCKTVHLEINNRASIYVGCSKIEGWGLTIGEAMMCGQAVACTDNEGYKEMAIDGVNSLISHIGDEKTLADNIILLVKNDQLRIRIAKTGLEMIKEFDYEKSYIMFREFITKCSL